MKSFPWWLLLIWVFYSWANLLPPVDISIRYQYKRNIECKILEILWNSVINLNIFPDNPWLKIKYDEDAGLIFSCVLRLFILIILLHFGEVALSNCLFTSHLMLYFTLFFFVKSKLTKLFSFKICQLLRFQSGNLHSIENEIWTFTYSLRRVIDTCPNLGEDTVIIVTNGWFVLCPLGFSTDWEKVSQSPNQT